MWYCPGGVLNAPHRPPGLFSLPSICPWSPRNVQVGNLALCPGIAPPSLSPARLLFGRHGAGLNRSGLFGGDTTTGCPKSLPEPNLFRDALRVPDCRLALTVVNQFRK